MDHCVPVGNGNGDGSILCWVYGVLGVRCWVYGVYVCILAHCAFYVYPKERA